MFTYESVHYSKLNLITYKAQPFLSVIPAEAVSLGMTHPVTCHSYVWSAYYASNMWRWL